MFRISKTQKQLKARNQQEEGDQHLKSLFLFEATAYTEYRVQSSETKSSFIRVSQQGT